MKHTYLVLFLSVLLSQLSGCKKNEVQPTSGLQGLWVGTYTVGQSDPVYKGQSFFFSFTLFSDGTMTYKGATPKDTVYANGTWNLTGNAFSFKVTTLNYEGGYQHTQTGTATYDGGMNVLTNGTIIDPITGGNASWSMSRY